MRSLVIVVLVVALVLAPASASAQGSPFAGQVCLPAGGAQCFPVSAVYGSYVARPGETVRITIPETDVVPSSRGVMLLYTSRLCTNTLFEYDFIVLEQGNKNTWTYTVPSSADLDPCVITLGASLSRCYGTCDQLPRWASSGNVFIGVDLGRGIAELFENDVVGWVLALTIGGAVGAIFVSRMLEFARAATEMREHVRRDEEKREESESEAGEWRDGRDS